MVPLDNFFLFRHARSVILVTSPTVVILTDLWCTKKDFETSFSISVRSTGYLVQSHHNLYSNAQECFFFYLILINVG